jgi:tetratricopeptide (TPR) repeat protein
LNYWQLHFSWRVCKTSCRERWIVSCFDARRRCFNETEKSFDCLGRQEIRTAIALISEAITLLPPESITEHAFFLCERAQVYFEIKDYLTSISNCQAALELRPAIAYLRLGFAQFELERFDEALQSYEKAMINDPSVNTAKEVQQRKEREAERARAREEEQSDSKRNEREKNEPRKKGWKNKRKNKPKKQNVC